MTWIRENWLGAVVLVAIVLSFFVSRDESIRRDHDQRDQLVAGCIRSSERTALTAAFQYDAADTRKKSGDTLVADRYTAEADGSVRLIPVADEDDRAFIAEIQFKTKAGKLVAELTPTAKSLQIQGCNAAFG